MNQIYLQLFNINAKTELKKKQRTFFDTMTFLLKASLINPYKTKYLIS
jgi:hypothetical protein